MDGKTTRGATRATAKHKPTEATVDDASVAGGNTEPVVADETPSAHAGEASAPTVTDPAPAASATAASSAPASKASVYRVAAGRSLSTKRGIKDAGSVLDPAKDVHGGVERLEQLVASGAVTKS